MLSMHPLLKFILNPKQYLFVKTKEKGKKGRAIMRLHNIGTRMFGHYVFSVR